MKIHKEIPHYLILRLKASNDFIEFKQGKYSAQEKRQKYSYSYNVRKDKNDLLVIVKWQQQAYSGLSLYEFSKTFKIYYIELNTFHLHHLKFPAIYFPSQFGILNYILYFIVHDMCFFHFSFPFCSPQEPVGSECRPSRSHFFYKLQIKKIPTFGSLPFSHIIDLSQI